MTVQALLTLTRYQLGDTTKPYKWSDAELIEYLNMSLDELCRRARLIRDVSTATYCKITLATSTASYALSSRVVSVIQAKHEDESVPMIRESIEIWNERNSAWASETGLPTRFCTNYIPGYITFRPVPTVTYNGDFVWLQVFRLQPANLTTSSSDLASTLVIKDEYCRGLMHGILWISFLKPGQLTFSQFKSAIHKKLWDMHISDTTLQESKLHWEGLDNIAAPDEAFT